MKARRRTRGVDANIDDPPSAAPAGEKAEDADSPPPRRFGTYRAVVLWAVGASLAGAGAWGWVVDQTKEPLPCDEDPNCYPTPVNPYARRCNENPHCDSSAEGPLFEVRRLRSPCSKENRCKYKLLLRRDGTLVHTDGDHSTKTQIDASKARAIQHYLQASELLRSKCHSRTIRGERKEYRAHLGPGTLSIKNPSEPCRSVLAKLEKRIERYAPPTEPR